MSHPNSRKPFPVKPPRWKSRTAIVTKPLDPDVLSGRRKLRATDFNQYIVDRGYWTY